MTRSLVLASVLAVASAAYAATPPPPDYVPLPAGARVYAGSFAKYDAFEFKRVKDAPGLQHGKLWRLEVWTDRMPPSPTGYYPQFRGALTAAGWTLVEEHGTACSMRLQKSGVDALLELNLSDTADFVILELGGTGQSLTLTPPAPTPEQLDPTGDFPYLTPWPGATRGPMTHDGQPLMVTIAGVDHPEAVGTGSMLKRYTLPPGVSTLELHTAYTDALKKAGWVIVASSQGAHQTDCTLTAHYAQQGRNVWAQLHATPRELSLQVADVGDLGAVLAHDCHATLHGVFFDFNQATLKPESEPVLTRVAQLLTSTPALTLAVQGHTDALGDPKFNQTLSENRAKSVVAWLTGHGIAASRLVPSGFGKAQPIADNGTDAGRAKNRRVEVVNRACKTK